MERTALTSPLKCFGLEQNQENPLCAQCQHFDDCASAMGHLAGRVTVDQAIFRLIPPPLKERFGEKDANVYDHDLDLVNIEKVYAFCHEWVFGGRPRGSLGQHRKLILRRVREAETSIKLFFLANMYGWKETQAGAFNSKVLTLDQAVTRLRTFAEVCQRRYGTFDTASLDRLMGGGDGTKDWIKVEERLFQSEIIAGSWIIRYKLFHSGDLFARLYEENEQALSPYWLAIEDTYQANVLWKHLNQMNDPDLNLPALTRKHRWNVAHILGRLKREPKRGFAVFTARERIMPRAVEKVLALRGFTPRDFQIGKEPVTNALKFWVRLAAAIQQYECLNFVDKYPSAFDSLKTGSR